MAVYQLDHRIPQIDPSAFIAAEATIIGEVRIERDSSVWPQATLRGDNEPIVVGCGSNVQEGAVLHTDPGCPLTLGEHVTVGHQAMLHGCTIGDGTLVGIQAIVLNRAVIGRNCLIGAGALVTEDQQIPDNSLVLGAPARVKRPLSAAEIERMQSGAESYVQRARRYRDALKRIE
jgi:carbonic anhydrase/acetyltransferase-like protein (isoleucine patch superfamily)